MTIFRHTLVLAAVTACLFSFGCAQEAKFGAVISETGTLAPYGTHVRQGMELAIDEVNASDGFLGSQVEWAFRDDGSDPDKGRAEAEKLIEEGYSVIVGAVSSAVTLAMAPVCEKEGVILFSPSASSPAISDAGEYVFRNYPSDVLEGTVMADFARDESIRKVAIVSVENAFGEGLSEVFAAKFPSRTRKLLGHMKFADGDMSTFPDIVAQLQELQPSGVYIVAYLDAVAELITLIREAGITSVLMASGAVTQEITVSAQGAAENLVYAQPSIDLESTHPPIAKFVQDYRSRYDEDPDIFAAHGYDAVKIIATAMNNVGFTITDEIKRGLLNLPRYDGVAGKTSFDERGDVIRYPQVFIIKDGHSIPFKQFEADGGHLDVPRD